MQEKEGITICATIHCPSSETFRLFDRVLLLQHGAVVYHGDNGTPVLNYFAENFPQVSAMTANVSNDYRVRVNLHVITVVTASE